MNAHPGIKIAPLEPLSIVPFVRLFNNCLNPDSTPAALLLVRAVGYHPIISGFIFARKNKAADDRLRVYPELVQATRTPAALGFLIT